MDLNRLKDPFPEEIVKWRVQRGGLSKDGRPWALLSAYVDARDVMNRLDEVCGADGWQTQIHVTASGAILMGIGIKIAEPEGMRPPEWIWRWDGCAPTADNEKQDAGGIKGGISSALKRAGAAYGIGRYLYSLGDTWAKISKEGQRGDKIKVKGKDDIYINWDPPKLAPWAVPKKREEGSAAPPAQPPAQERPQPVPGIDYAIAPAGAASPPPSPPEPDRGPDGTWTTPEEEQTKKIHALGEELYPDRAEWDKNRQDLCLVVSKKRTASLKDLTAVESSDLYGRLMNENNRRKALPRASVPNEATPGQVDPMAHVMHFGKNKGMSLAQIKEHDSGYIDSLLGRDDEFFEYKGSVSKDNQNLKDALVLIRVSQADGVGDHSPRPEDWPEREPEPAAEASPFLPGDEGDGPPDDIPF